MSLYLDASVILSLLVTERFSQTVEDFLHAATDSLIVSELAAAEVASGFSCLTRMAVVTPQSALARLADFDTWRSGVAADVVVQPADFRLASLFVRRFDLKLRAPDALHAAVCRRGGHTLVTLDQRLASAARALDVNVEDLAA